jgi:hypothetical protein
MHKKVSEFFPLKIVVKKSEVKTNKLKRRKQNM